MKTSGEVRKSQSAMEYLMTYGWAILIVAVVLAALFQLGVFSGAESPRAQPGTCSVVRPMGIGTSKYASLQGVCTGLLPEYVAQFNGQNSQISVPNMYQASSGTFAMWLNPNSGLSTYDWVIGNGNVVLFAPPPSMTKPFLRIYIYSVNKPAYAPGSLSLNRWNFLAGTWYSDGSNTIFQTYLDGVAGASSTQLLLPPATLTLYMSSSSSKFDGMMANVQMYNASLSANEIMALYKEGIGGVPIRVDTLVGWWPLNGNVNDTSGNLHNGVPTAVTYTSSWTSGYSLR